MITANDLVAVGAGHLSLTEVVERYHAYVGERIASQVPAEQLRRVLSLDDVELANRCLAQLVPDLEEFVANEKALFLLEISANSGTGGEDF